MVCLVMIGQCVCARTRPMRAMGCAFRRFRARHWSSTARTCDVTTTTRVVVARRARREGVIASDFVGNAD